MGRAAVDVFPARPIYYYLLPERDPSQHAAFFTRVALLAVNITCPDAEGIEPQSYTFVLPYPMAHDHVCQRGSFGLCAVRTFPPHVRCQVSGCRTGQLAVLLLVRWPGRNLPGRP
jgi:hypothetical protein